MPSRMTVADPRVDAVRGCVAVERGPLVYCLEEADLTGPRQLESARLSPGMVFCTENLDIGGEPVTALVGEARTCALPPACPTTLRTEPATLSPPAPSGLSPTASGATGIQG